MGDFQKVKQFLLNYQDYINKQKWLDLLEEANSTGLDNNDVHLMIEMFKKAKLPITQADLHHYLGNEIIWMLNRYQVDKNKNNFQFLTDVGGMIIIKDYFEYNNLHIAGYSWDYFKMWLVQEEDKFPNLKQIGWVM